MILTVSAPGTTRSLELELAPVPVIVTPLVPVIITPARPISKAQRIAGRTFS